MNILVGCPTRDRAWSLPGWFAAVDRALGEANLTATAVFIYPLNDVETETEITKGISKASNLGDFLTIRTDETGEFPERNWTFERVTEMADIRNRLLRLVREVEPDLFWSLDSDIHVHPETLVSALEILGAYDAVGTSVNMDRHGLPSYANLSQGGLLRFPQEGAFEVDVIMASKLLKKETYNVDYVPHILGEDVGWAIGCRRAGLRLGWDGRTHSRHLLSREDINVGT